jgi:hypothetical protein
MNSPTTPSPAALLRLDRRDRAGLEWVRQRAGWWIRAMARRRKYLPRGEPYSEAEAATLRALMALEAAAGELLKRSSPPAGITQVVRAEH